MESMDPDLLSILAATPAYIVMAIMWAMTRRFLREEQVVAETLKRIHKLDLEAAWAEGYRASQDDVRSGRRQAATNPYRQPREDAS